MEVEHRGLAIAQIDTPQRPPRDGIGQQPKVSAAACRPVSARNPYSRNWYFEQARPHFMSESRRIGNTVVIVADRIEARAVTVPGVRNVVECPFIRRVDREARGPVAKHLASG